MAEDSFDPDIDPSGDPNAPEEPSIDFPLASPHVPHYYGDAVRQIFVGVGAFMLVMAPFLSKVNPAFLTFGIVGAVVLVCLAALTSPRKQWVLLADAAAAAMGIIAFELTALLFFAQERMIWFVIFETAVIALMFALYFSVKTLRAMMSHQIGRRNRFGDIVSR